MGKKTTLSLKYSKFYLAIKDIATGKGFMFPFPLKYSVKVGASTELQYLLLHPK